MNIVHSPASPQTAAATDLGQLLEPVKAELELVEQWLGTNLIDDNAFITELLQQLCQAGGKRIRPALALLSAKATASNAGEVGQLQIILAVLTELIHTASLVHDDVIDRASMRRGQETINRRWNDRLAVLLGDLLFAQASICLARIMNPVIVGIYGQVLGDLCAGEIRQMKLQFVCNVDWDAYIRKTIGKTASLFAAGCHSAPILNGCRDDVVGAMKDYGLNLGICFQIVDDLLDVTATSAELGKPAGSDLAHGVINAPALFVLQRKDEPAGRLRQLISSRAVAEPDGIAEALDLIRSNGGIEATLAYARGYADKSREALRAIPPSRYRESLAGIVDFMLMRTR
ncbi:MAG TPA: polyprenyl synthetase family protein [Candidatus Obscuribacterales bacterium]